jgi:hypothetical protein
MSRVVCAGTESVESLCAYVDEIIMNINSGATSIRLFITFTITSPLAM